MGVIAVSFAVLAGAAVFVTYLILSGGRQQDSQVDVLPEGNAQAPVDLSELLNPDGFLQFAKAISVAEGFGISQAIPTLSHNPGDLAIGSVGFGTDGKQGITIFETDDDGWRALYHELMLIATDRSHVYTTDMTILEMADKWTGSDNPKPWATNVARAMGADVNTPIGTFLY